MLKADNTQIPPPSVLDIDTGNRMANVLMRITPEDGAVGRVYDIDGKIVDYGRLRGDWPGLCLKAAQRVEARREEIEERVRSMHISPWMHEHLAEAMMLEMIAERDRLLADG